MLTKVCKRCGRFIVYPKVYCDECKVIVDEQRKIAKEEAIKKAKRKYNRKYNKKRDPKYVRFYNSSEWKMLSKKYVQDKGYRCEECGDIATEVHHKIPIQTDEGWNLRLDYNNLECICVKCHNKRHKRFQKSNKKKNKFP